MKMELTAYAPLSYLAERHMQVNSGWPQQPIAIAESEPYTRFGQIHRAGKSGQGVATH